MVINGRFYVYEQLIVEAYMHVRVHHHFRKACMHACDVKQDLLTSYDFIDIYIYLYINIYNVTLILYLIKSM